MSTVVIPDQIVLDRIQLAAEQSNETDVFEDALSIFPRFKKDHLYVARAYARTLRMTAERKVVTCGTDIVLARRLMKFIESILRMFAADDFDSYMLFIEWNRVLEQWHSDW